MTRRSLTLPVLLPAVLLALAACGGGDDAKQEYVDAASAVCEEADADFSALATPTTPAGFAPFAQQTVQIAERAQGELAGLTPPEDDAADLRSKVLDPFAALVDDGKAFAAKVEAAGTDQAKLLPLLSERPTAEGIDLDYLRSYGLEACADAIGKAG